jgi:bifunctional non-homologous end joining protein LigD
LPKRTRSWVKVKLVKHQEVVVGGYTDPSGSRTGFGALLLGYYDQEGKLIYCGRVGTGFNAQSLADIYGRRFSLARACAGPCAWHASGRIKYQSVTPSAW